MSKNVSNPLADLDEALRTIFEAREVTFTFHRKRLEFGLANSVFSSAGVDKGSALLLRYLNEHRPASDQMGEGQRILDLGCGHGTLGIVLKALDPSRQVTFVDRDALALGYTSHNLDRNGMADGTEVTGSLGLDDVKTQPFDLVVSNLPGKVGPEVLTAMVDGSGALLAETAGSGRNPTLAVVVVAPLAEEVAEYFEHPLFGEVIRKGNKAHQVFIANVVAGADIDADSIDAADRGSSFDDGIYDRSSADFSLGRTEWSATTVRGIDEYDNLSFATRQACRVLRKLPSEKAVVVNPGQGHRAVVAALNGHDVRTVASRDLLSLKSTARVFSENGLKAPNQVHAISLPDEVLADTSLMVINVSGSGAHHIRWLAHEVTRYLDFGQRRTVLVTGKASTMGRFEAGWLRRRKGRIVVDRSERGFRALAYSGGS